MLIRTASQRRRAAREIDRIAVLHANVIAFPLRRVGVVAGITERRAEIAVVIAWPDLRTRNFAPHPHAAQRQA